MGDARCIPDLAPTETDQDVEVRPPWWRDIALLPSALSGLFLLAGYALEWTGLHIPAMVLQSAALLAGAYTFVPGAIRRLGLGEVRRRMAGWVLYGPSVCVLWTRLGSRSPMVVRDSFISRLWTRAAWPLWLAESLS